MVSITLFVSIAFIDFNEIKKYDWVFSTGDALVSWNGWATALADGVYQPYNAAYPILYPGIWSLIYQSQGDNINFIVTKGTTLVLASILLGYSICKLIEDFSFATFTILSTVIIIFINHFSMFTSGYMDGPVSALMFLGLVTFIQALNNLDKSKDFTPSDINIIYTSTFLSGAAAITKQPGIFACIILTAFIVTLTLRKKLPILSSRNFLLVLFLPSFSYFVLFMLSGKEVIGNINELAGITKSLAGEQNVYLHAYDIISSKIDSMLLILLTLSSLINLTFKKTYTAYFGLTCLLFSIIAFIIFANCCSYHYRNGIFVVILLCTSAVAGATHIPCLITRNNYRSVLLPNTFKKTLVIFIALAFGAGVLFLPDKRSIFEIHNKELNKIGVQNVNSMLHDNLEKLSDNGIIITSYVYVIWLPEFKNRAKYCAPHRNYHLCIKNATKDRRDIFLLKRRGEYQDINDYVYPRTLIDKTNSWELFRFYTRNNKELLEYINAHAEKNSPP